METRSHFARVWPLGGRATALLLAACVATGVAGGFALHAIDTPPRPPAMVFPTEPANALAGDAVWGPGRRPAPPFALRDQSNRLVTLSAQRGRAVLLTFMDSQCKLVCTLEGPMLHQALQQLGPRRAAVTLLVVSVNPWQDTEASSRRVAARYGFLGDWHWLRGSPSRLRPIWRAYGIAVLHTAWDISHSTAIYLLDGRGDERAGFGWPFTAEQVAGDLRRLAPPQAS